MYDIQSSQAIATTSSNCARILAVLTAPEVFAQKLVGYRYYVELVSNKSELQDSRAVPTHTQVVDVVVMQPTRDAIAQLISTCDWLKDYSIVSYNEPSFDRAPF